MKRSSFILSLIFGLFATTFILTACSSDDEESGNSLVGTWIVKSISEEDDLEFTSITFKSNGNVEYPGMESNYYMKWTTTGNTLRIDMGEGHPDDFIIGTYNINGNTLTYSYHWEDYDGKWVGENTYTMILERK